MQRHQINRHLGQRSKKNNGEKEDNNSSPKTGLNGVEKVCGRSNVYTNPLTNPQRNPNVDSKRTEPLTVMEIEAIKEANEQYPELGPWNISLLLSNEFDVHVSTMSILRVLDPERYKSSKIAEKAPFGCKSIVARAKHWMVPIS